MNFAEFRILSHVLHSLLRKPRCKTQTLYDCFVTLTVNTGNPTERGTESLGLGPVVSEGEAET